MARAAARFACGRTQRSIGGHIPKPAPVAIAGDPARKDKKR